MNSDKFSLAFGAGSETTTRKPFERKSVVQLEPITPVPMTAIFLIDCAMLEVENVVRLDLVSGVQQRSRRLESRKWIYTNESRPEKQLLLRW